MSNLNVEKEYYLNLPVTYIDTVGKVENRLKINYTPNSEVFNQYNQDGDVCENMGEYCITLQSKFSWLLDTVPDRYTITHALVSGFVDKMTWIKFNIPFLDTVLEARIKETGFQSSVSFEGTNKTNNLDENNWKDIDFPINDIYEEPIWEFKQNRPPVVAGGVIVPRITASNGKIYIRNILQNNKLINIDTNFTFISTFYEVKITEDGSKDEKKLATKTYSLLESMDLNTLNLETNIGDFPIISPNNITVSVGTNSYLHFQGKINGEKIKSFCINFYNEDYSLAFTTGWVSGSNDIKTGQNVYSIFGHILTSMENLGDKNKNKVGENSYAQHYPNGTLLYNGDIFNYFLGTSFDEPETTKLYYNVSLSKYPPYEAWKKPYFTSKDYFVKLSKPIEFKLTHNSNVLNPLKTNNINNTIVRFVGEYSQNFNVPIDCYSFYLYDENENLIDSKEEVCSANIFYKYDAFEYGKDYQLKIFIKNKEGQTYENSYLLQNKCNVYKMNMSNELFINSDTKNKGVAILMHDTVSTLTELLRVLKVWEGTITTLKSVINFTILRKEKNSNISKNIFSREINSDFLETFRASNSFIENNFKLDSKTLQSLTASGKLYGLVDYSVKNNKDYIYSFYMTIDLNEDLKYEGSDEVFLPKGVNLIPLFENEENSISVTTHWDSFILYPLLKANTGAYELKLDDLNNVIAWNFNLNCEENEISLNQDKTIFTSFCEKPKIAVGKLNYHSGSLKCLLGEFIENNSYYEPSSLMESWEEFLKTSSCGLFKNPKGDAFVVFIENNSSRSYMNEIANEYLFNGELTVKPSTISFNYIEIDDIEEKLYIQVGD